MECVLGASMQARAIHGLTSLSPTPVIPSSVCTNTTMSSCAEEVASVRNVGDEQDMAFDVSDLHFTVWTAVAFSGQGCNWTFTLGCVTQVALLKMFASQHRVEFVGRLLLLIFCSADAWPKPIA